MHFTINSQISMDIVTVNQWRIQDFHENRMPTAKLGRQAIILANLCKNAWKWKNIGPGQGGGSLGSPLRFANDNQNNLNKNCIVSLNIRSDRKNEDEKVYKEIIEIICF